LTVDVKIFAELDRNNTYYPQLTFKINAELNLTHCIYYFF
jgi:hypothetical protein